MSTTEAGRSSRTPEVVTTPPSDGRIVIQAWLASRGLIALVALLLALTQGRTLTELVSNWDVQHFVELAQGGYRAKPDGTLMAFFPALPALLAAFGVAGVSPAVAGVAIALVGSGFAAAALLRLGGHWAAVVWLFAPTAVFTTVPYTESLFCAFAFWSWVRARQDRWASAAVLCALAATCRVSGLFLVGALLVLILSHRGLSWAEKARQARWLLIPVATILAFVVYLHAISGSWTAWYHAQSTGWVRGLTWPWDAFRHTIPAIVPGAYGDHPWWAFVFRAEVLSMAVGIGVTLWCLVRRRDPGERRWWGEAGWVGVQVLAFSLSYWFFSVNRAVLLWFPLWIMVARWGTGRPAGTTARTVHRAAVLVAFGLEAALMIFWSWLFFTGHWAS